MPLKLLTVQKDLRARLATVIFARRLVHTEHVLLQIVTLCKSLRANLTSVVSPIKVNAEDVSSDARFVTECFVAPVTAELCVLVGSPYVS